MSYKTNWKFSWQLSVREEIEVAEAVVDLADVGVVETVVAEEALVVEEVALVEEEVVIVEAVVVEASVEEVVAAEAVEESQAEWGEASRCSSSLIAMLESSLPGERKMPLWPKTWPLVILFMERKESQLKKKVSFIQYLFKVGVRTVFSLQELRKLNIVSGIPFVQSWLLLFLVV